MSKIDDGGPAFPTHYNSHGGMTLRDWFAGQALAGMHTYGLDNFIPHNTEDADALMAKFSYDAADAMLAARQSKGE